MFLEHTEHVGFKRFKLNPISSFTYKPNNRLTFVIGTNGAGKTSLMGQWDPSPKAASDYKPGGHCKQIFRDTKNNKYELRSEFDLKSGSKHHFIRNGEALNNGKAGGTAKVQKLLVEKYFNFDKELHKVLSGQTSFTKMGPKQREKVITELSNCDLTYAFDIYGQLQSGIRNSKGTQKDLATNIAKDKETLNSFHIDAIKAEQAALKTNLAYLTTQIISGVKNNVDPERLEFEKLEESFLTTITKHVRGTAYVDNLGFDSLLNLEEGISGNNDRINYLLNNLRHLDNLANDALNTKSRLERTAKLSGTELNKERDLALEALEKLPKGLSQYETINATSSDYTLLETNLGLFITNHGKLPEVKHVDEKINNVKNWLRGAPNQTKVVNEELSKIDYWLEHAQHGDKVNCPNCKLSFLPDLDIKEKPEKEATRLKLIKTLENIELGIEKGKKLIEDHELSLSVRRELLNIFNVHTEFDKYKENIFSNGVNINQELLNIRKDHMGLRRLKETEVAREDLNTKIKQLDALINQSQQGGLEEEIQVQANKHESALKERESLGDELLLLKAERDALYAVKKQFIIEDELLIRSREQFKRLKHLANELVLFDANKFVNNLMDGVHVKLAKTQQTILDYNSLASSLKRLEQIESEAKARQKDWELISAVLSPVDGIIAEQLKGHTNVLISHMNQIIEQIWEHNLELQPCGVGSGKLDYYFPMYVASDTELTPDVSFGSKGEREVIDLAFTIVLMLQRDLTEYPLYLDEVASSFDKKHRTNFMRYLNELMSNNKISQIFMINHYNDMYGIVGDHDVVVLDKSNVVVPERYNEQVEIM